MGNFTYALLPPDFFDLSACDGDVEVGSICDDAPQATQSALDGRDRPACDGVALQGAAVCVVDVGAVAAESLRIDPTDQSGEVAPRG